MTKKMITYYTTSLCLAFLMAGAAITYASESETAGTLSSDISGPSEVAGTISSDATSDSENDGDITGTVSSESENDGDLTGTVSSDTENDGNLSGTVSSDASRSSGGTVGGSRSSVGSTNDGSSSSAPSGAVLGTAAQRAQTPGFPNAGIAPQASSADQPLWSVLMNFVKNIFSF